jgi:hypothetical protein
VPGVRSLSAYDDSQPVGPEHPGRPADASPETADIGAALARVAAGSEGLADADDRGRILSGRDALGSLGTALARSARGAGSRAVLGGRWLTDVLVEAAPRIPVRDLATLRAHHPGLDGEDLADALVTSASRATAAVGAAGGAVAAVQWAAPPTLLVGVPVQLAVETLAVAAIETKLLAELHAVYGADPVGTGTERARAFLTAWAGRRGVDPLVPMSATTALGAAAKQQLRRRLAGRLGRNFTTVGPLLTGAVAGSVVNARETKRLAGLVRADLRRSARLAESRPSSGGRLSTPKRRLRLSRRR